MDVLGWTSLLCISHMQPSKSHRYGFVTPLRTSPILSDQVCPDHTVTVEEGWGSDNKVGEIDGERVSRSDLSFLS